MYIIVKPKQTSDDHLDWSLPMICSVSSPSHSGHSFICSSQKPTVQETVSLATQMILIHTLFQQLWPKKAVWVPPPNPPIEGCEAKISCQEVKDKPTLLSSDVFSSLLVNFVPPGQFALLCCWL